MKDITAAVLISMLALFAGGAAAGEDSTDRWHGVGPAFYEVQGGLKRFAESDPSEPPLTRAPRQR